MSVTIFKIPSTPWWEPKPPTPTLTPQPQTLNNFRAIAVPFSFSQLFAQIWIWFIQISANIQAVKQW